MQNDDWMKLELTLKFTGKDAQALIEALSLLPYHVSANFIAAIQQQTSPQIMDFDLKKAKAKPTTEEQT